MTMSQKTTWLSNPTGSDKVPLGTLAYFRERNRNRIYDLVLSEFQRTDISQANLARRLGKRPEVINRLLGAPGNWTLDTVSDLLFAISGGEAEYTVTYPLAESPRNMTEPEWLRPPNDYSWAEYTPRPKLDQHDHSTPSFELSEQLKQL